MTTRQQALEVLRMVAQTMDAVVKLTELLMVEEDTPETATMKAPRQQAAIATETVVPAEAERTSQITWQMQEEMARRLPEQFAKRFGAEMGAEVKFFLNRPYQQAGTREKDLLLLMQILHPTTPMAKLNEMYGMNIEAQQRYILRQNFKSRYRNTYPRIWNLISRGDSPEAVNEVAIEPSEDKAEVETPKLKLPTEISSKVIDSRNKIVELQKNLRDSGKKACERFEWLLKDRGWRMQDVQETSLRGLTESTKGSEHPETVRLFCTMLKLMQLLDGANLPTEMWTANSVRNWFQVGANLAQVILQAHERNG